MTGLLVSVRGAAEAEAALAGGANVIDVKEPDRGALGAADPATWRAVLDVVAERAPVSAALGELFPCGMRNAECGAADSAIRVSHSALEGLAFAKIGLAGAARKRDWPSHWREALACLPSSVAAVAVAYADWESANAPRPEEVIDAGADLGCTMLLIDTFAKERGHLLDHLPLPALDRLSSRARRRASQARHYGGMQVVLAGSLSKLLLRQVLPLSPALVAVRGAVCRPDRRGRVDALLVRELAAALLADGSTVVRPSAALSRGA